MRGTTLKVIMARDCGDAMDATLERPGVRRSLSRRSFPNIDR